MKTKLKGLSLWALTVPLFVAGTALASFEQFGGQDAALAAVAVHSPK